MKRIKLSLLIALLVGFVAVPASAANIIGGENLSLNEPQLDDVYAAGAQLIFNESFAEDLSAAGATIQISGDVGKDLMAAGADVRIEGDVSDDVRVAGANIFLNGNVGDDVLLAGSSVATGIDSVIAGEAIITGGVLVINGDVTGNALITGGEVVVNGNINGEADIRGGRLTINGQVSGQATLAADELIIGSDAVFASNVRYYNSGGEISFGNSLQGGVATFDESLAVSFSFDSSQTLAQAALWFLVSILSGALIILLLLWGGKGFWKKAGKEFNDKFWLSLGAGAIYFVVVPFAAVILMMTVIGIPVGLFLLFLYGFSIFVANIVASLVIAKWLEQKQNREWGKATYYFVSLGVYVIFRLVGLIPFVGWLIVLVFAVTGFGAALMTKRGQRKALRAQS